MPAPTPPCSGGTTPTSSPADQVFLVTRPYSIMNEWTAWQPLEDCVSHNGPACYQVRFLVAASVQPVPRWWATDQNGILSIGSTKKCASRVRQFRRGLQKGRGHSSANRLSSLHGCSPFLDQFPAYSLEVRFQSFTDLSQAQGVEADLLHEYQQRFGELPPLNSSKPRAQRAEL